MIILIMYNKKQLGPWKTSCNITNIWKFTWVSHIALIPSSNNSKKGQVIFNFLHGFSPRIIVNVFHLQEKSSYNSGSFNELGCRNRVKSTDHIQKSIQNSKLYIFKFKTRKWKLECLCGLCKYYLQSTGLN